MIVALFLLGFWVFCLFAVWIDLTDLIAEEQAQEIGAGENTTPLSRGGLTATLTLLQRPAPTLFDQETM